MKHKITIETLTLAFCIALFPPIWAVIAPNINVSTGAVALICAGLYVTNGNKRSDAVKISIGFLLGDFWAVFALKIMDIMNFNADMELFITLFILGGLAVLISACFPKWIFTPAWLCGWAVGLTILAPIGWGHLGSIPVQIAAAMLAGIWYVGVFVDIAQRKMVKVFKNKEKGSHEK